MTLREHSCPTCGANLNLDTVKQMYECPFCGSAFDYEYFREDNVLELAGKAMALGEFGSASDAYGFMLQKEPSNFIALRGRILSALRLKKLSELQKTSNFLTLDYPTALENTDKAVSESLPEHREYFDTMKDMFETGKVYKSETTIIDGIKKDREELYAEVRRLTYRENENYTQMGDPNSSDPADTTLVSPKSSLIFIGVIYALCVLVAFLVFGVTANNPYSKEATKTTETTTYSYTPNYNVVLPDNFKADKTNDIRFSIEVYNQRQAHKKAQERAAEQKAERERVKNYEKWEVDNKDRTPRLIRMLLIPLIPLGFAAAYYLLKMKAISDINSDMSKVYDKIDELNKDIKHHEDNLKKAQTTIGNDILKLKRIDPFTQQ